MMSVALNFTDGSERVLFSSTFESFTTKFCDRRMVEARKEEGN